MANGLFCSEALVSTPKYRHDSNSENNPPDLSKTCQLLCSEVLEDAELHKPVQTKPVQGVQQTFHHPPVKADCDNKILRDDRVLQNLLKNEDR